MKVALYTIDPQNDFCVADSGAEIKAALMRNGWVQARAARDLGLTQRQIGYRIKKFNLDRPEF